MNGLLASLPRAESELDDFVDAYKAAQQVKLDAISARLSREVMQNYASFIDGMRHISEIDMDVSRASIHVSNSLRKLANAKESLVTGAWDALRVARARRVGFSRSRTHRLLCSPAPHLNRRHARHHVPPPPTRAHGRGADATQLAACALAGRGGRDGGMRRVALC